MPDRPDRRSDWRLAALVAFLAAALAPAPAKAWDPPAAPGRPGKVLIEFGWDEPDTAFLRREVAAMERTPFDGCVFHAVARGPSGTAENFAWKFWGRRAFSAAELSGAFDDLKATPLRRFRHNLLRVNTTPADLDWFDDHAAITANARLAARLAREGHCRGVLFDVEAYENPLFDYRKQRLAGERSWDDHSAQARRRGREVMDAFQDGFPGLTLLLTFGPSLVDKQTNGGRTPAKDAPDGLLVPFVQGMADARRGETRLVDGFELSYGFRDPKRFDEALARVRSLEPALEAGFGLWLDHDWRKNGWDVDKPAANYFSPEAFETAVRAALERSDGIVWVYTETPRWWTADGRGPVKLPAAYVEAIRKARRGLATDSAEPPEGSDR
jgi:hypothetical protein